MGPMLAPWTLLPGTVRTDNNLRCQWRIYTDDLPRTIWPQKLQEVVSGSVVQTLCHQVTTECSTTEYCGFEDEILPDDLIASQIVGTIDWRKEQLDSVFAMIVQCVSDG